MTAHAAVPPAPVLRAPLSNRSSKPRMNSFPSSPAAVVGAVFAAFALLAGSPAQAADDEIEKGRQKADEVCAACHGKDGNTPIDPSYPKLAGQYRDYLEHSLLDYKNDRRKNPIMGAQAKPLSRDDIRNVAAYYASLSGTLEKRR